MIENIDYVECKICGIRSSQLSTLHFRKHGLSTKQYKEQYGVTYTMCENQRKKTSIGVKKYMRSNPEAYWETHKRSRETYRVSDKTEGNKKRRAKLLGVPKPPRSDEMKINASRLTQQIGDNRRYKTGYFSDSYGESHYFASSYEERRMKFLDSKGIKFSKRHNHTVIWFDAMGKSHAYTPDLLIGDILEEIKPKYKLKHPDVIFKAKSAEEYCKKHSLTYRIITEDTLEKVI